MNTANIDRVWGAARGVELGNSFAPKEGRAESDTLAAAACCDYTGAALACLPAGVLLCGVLVSNFRPRKVGS